MTVLLAFTLEHASRVTGIPESTIRYWSDTGILKPSLVNTRRGGAFGRIYSFRDLVGLRTISELRNAFGVSLQSLRLVGERLRDHSLTPWAELRFYISGDHLFFRDPDTSLMLSAIKPGQIALIESLDLVRVANETEQRAKSLLKRSESQVGRISVNRYVFGNRPVIAGTRIPTEAIWEFHEAGFNTDQILAEYPRLTADDVTSAIVYECEIRQDQRAS